MVTVKEFKGRHDHKDYIKRGIKTENLFINEAIKLGMKLRLLLILRICLTILI